MYFPKYSFQRWCSDAVSGIIFPPDREKVSEELYQHMEDHCDALMAQGIERDEAERMTVEAMGDAWEIAPQLAAIHHPFWGYFLRVTRIFLVLLLVVTVIPLGKHLYNTRYQEPNVWGFNINDPDAYAANGHELLLFTEPDCTAKSDGYTFTASTAAVWRFNREDSDGTPLSTAVLSFRMAERNPLPWAEHADVGGWFWAEDSLGNRYVSDMDRLSKGSKEPSLNAWGSATSPFTYAYQFWINDFDFENAQWLTVHYDRDGRDLTWHIDLTEGRQP